MPTPHKNKTLATLLAFILGAVGAHRFYLCGSVDRLGLAHLCSLPIAGLVVGLLPEVNWFYKLLPIVVSFIAGCIEALVIGVTQDDKWDAKFNAGSGKVSNTRWFQALLLVVIMLVGMTVMIGTIARVFDLLYTGGAYG